METVQTRLKRRHLPLVVIAGRPNAGKSTLFNRLLRERRAITDPTPGVTRDPIEAECLLPYSQKPVMLVDTGGFKMDKAGLDSEVVRRTMETIEKADLIVLLMDITTITGEDEHFVDLLRPYSKKVLLAVNKADSPERDAMAYNFLSYGFPAMVFISAEHNRNIDELEERIVERLDFGKIEEYEDVHSDVRLAIIGKPNTGKSTLMNRFLGQEKSLVSDVAGTTRDVVEGRFVSGKHEFTVLDTAGIRRKSKVTQDVEYYSVNRAVKTIDDCDVVILMIDAREGLTDQDKKIAGLAMERGRGIILALNKWDEMPDVKNSLQALTDKIHFHFGQIVFAPVLALSAKTGFGVEELLKSAVRLFNQLNRRIETGPLNQAVKDWMEHFPPPMGRSTHFKLRYATQVSANPVKFVFFVSRPQAVSDSYLAFLRNRIRKDLGFESIPISIAIRGPQKDKEW